MRQYKYKTKNSQGKLVSGAIDAESENEAVSELRRRGLTIISLAQSRGGSSGSSGGSSFFSMSVGGAKGKARGRRVKSGDLVVITRQLATMVSAGIPLVEGIEIIEEQASNPTLRDALGEVVSDVRSGKDLSQALSRHPKIFSDIYINMIKAGEASGQLDTVLDRLADYQEDAEKLKSEIKSAMTYPVVSLVMVTGITLFLLVFIIPKFKEMFSSMGVELPWITSALLVTSDFLRENMLIWASAVVAIIVGIVMYFRTPKGLVTKDWLILKLPVFGSLFSKVAISRFSRTFSTLIRSGVPILGALEIVSQTCGNRIFSDGIDSASRSVRDGETLGEPLAKTGIFPPMVTRMISIGERSGALESLLEKISEFYDQQVSATVKALTSLIEPLMIGVMGFLVGGMVMAIFLPIFKMIGSMGG
ncbi:MAG: type II secretion system F family protein [Planctomycetes bacterium]|nr:type II secretion system F family protein [Planctomycetota bacterium]